MPIHSMPLYQEADYIPLSALQHYLFCPRQCALIHLEQIWRDNYLTTSGKLLHEHVDSGDRASRRDLHQATALRLVSHRYGLTGIADLVEFREWECERDNSGKRIATTIPGLKRLWRPFPVEYKRGKEDFHDAAKVQLCAQAICLEEMLDIHIPFAVLYRGATRRRTEVDLDAPLRQKTVETADNVRTLLRGDATPHATYTPLCEACSLFDTCLPRKATSGSSASEWLDQWLERNAP